MSTEVNNDDLTARLKAELSAAQARIASLSKGHDEALEIAKSAHERADAYRRELETIERKAANVELAAQRSTEEDGKMLREAVASNNHEKVKALQKAWTPERYKAATYAGWK